MVEVEENHPAGTQIPLAASKSHESMLCVFYACACDSDGHSFQRGTHCVCVCVGVMQLFRFTGRDFFPGARLPGDLRKGLCWHS